MSNVTPIKPGSESAVRQRPADEQALADRIDRAYCLIDQATAVSDAMQALLEADDVEPRDGLYVTLTYATQTLLRYSQKALTGRPMDWSGD